MTTEASALQTDANQRIVELVPGVVFVCQPVSESKAYVRLNLHVNVGSSRAGRGHDEWRFDMAATQYISEKWTNLALYGLCMDWYMWYLFMRRGGLRAAVRAARELKNARDACRARRCLIEEHADEEYLCSRLPR